MHSLPIFLEHIVGETRDYLFDVRKDHIEFRLWFNEDESAYNCKFSYGRVGRGSKIESVCAAIANAIIAVEQDVLKH